MQFWTKIWNLAVLMATIKSFSLLGDSTRLLSNKLMLCSLNCIIRMIEPESDFSDIKVNKDTESNVLNCRPVVSMQYWIGSFAKSDMNDDFLNNNCFCWNICSLRMDHLQNVFQHNTNTLLLMLVLVWCWKPFSRRFILIWTFLFNF